VAPFLISSSFAFSSILCPYLYMLKVYPSEVSLLISCVYFDWLIPRLPNTTMIR
jgi:hypothetical protein